jgi:CTP synthase (UTP-ammonia lyase)
VRLSPGTIAARAYGSQESAEEFRCNFGLNPEYREQVEKGGLQVTGLDENGEVRIVELRGHPFFVATLFLPQLSSRPGGPHPLILAFLKVAATFRPTPASQVGAA